MLRIHFPDSDEAGILKCLLLIAHGSRKAAANDEIFRLAKRVESLTDNPYQCVIPAFLELAQPDIPSGIEQCLQQGAKSILVVPYFLAGGNHVGRDIPQHLEIARQRHPDIVIKQAAYIGNSEAMAELVMQCAISSD